MEHSWSFANAESFHDSAKIKQAYLCSRCSKISLTQNLFTTRQRLRQAYLCSRCSKISLSQNLFTTRQSSNKFGFALAAPRFRVRLPSAAGTLKFV